jgi:lipopolysaccharide biosynthesis glycosyltransferase
LESGSIHTSNDACISSHTHVAELKYIFYIATNGVDAEERRKLIKTIREQHAFCCDKVAKIGNLHLHISMYVYKYIYT